MQLLSNMHAHSKVERLLPIKAECGFRPFEGIETGNEITRQLFSSIDTIPSIFNRLDVISAFSIVVNGGMLIAATRGRFRP